MQYYQQGLDWQPKTISKNGGWLDGHDVAQKGIKLPSVRDLITDTMNRKIQEHKGKGKETSVTKKDNTKTVTPKETKKLSGKQQNELAQRQSEEQANKDWVQGSMEEAYKSPLMSPGYFTPEGMAIGALQGATKMGPDLYEGNYKGAALDALMMLPEAGNIVKKLIPIKTPAGFQNRVFDSNIQLGEYEGVGHLSEPGYNYRVLSPKEINAIQESKGVFPRVGKQKGGNANVKYWTKGNKKNWFGDKADLETIRVNETNFNPDKIVNSKHVELYNKQTGKFNPLKQGGIIKDDRGQWDHPGEITEIGSNDITMEGVPYDVLGVSDTGDTKLMKPGKNYKFKGKKVTEYPMAQNGLRQEQKGLQNLDNLTNFTNYNTKQPGGWMDNLI